MDDFEKNLKKIVEEEKIKILAHPGKSENEKREYLKKVFQFSLLPFFEKIIKFYIEPLGEEAKIPLIQFDSEKRVAWAELTWDTERGCPYDEVDEYTTIGFNSLKLTLDEDFIFVLFKAEEEEPFFSDTFADDCEGEWIERLSEKILYIIKNKLYVYTRYPEKSKVKVS